MYKSPLKGIIWKNTAPLKQFECVKSVLVSYDPEWGMYCPRFQHIIVKQPKFSKKFIGIINEMNLGI